MIRNIIKYIFLFFCLVTVTFASLVIIYSEKDKIIPKLKNYVGSEYTKYDKKEDEYWAKKILEGGYILHFRHAERDKWIDVKMYDALESDVHENGNNESRYAEKDYFSAAVCLNDRGKVQARAMGEHIQSIGLPISHVISSVSCRARQTAELAFGGYDSLHRILVHKGPYIENEDERVNTLKKLYLSLPKSDNSNAIVSAHNGVINHKMFENFVYPDINLEEGGFYVIEARNNKLYLVHEFHNFQYFQRVFYPR